jgi:hypothetical protein
VPERIRKVLDHLVSTYVVSDERKDIELNASPAESGADIEADQRDVERRENERANELFEPFRAGLQLAHRARSLGQETIALDDREPEQDRIADALIRFLVRYELASSTTEETEPRHYIYRIGVDWERLADVARAVDVDLDEALR